MSSSSLLAELDAPKWQTNKNNIIKNKNNIYIYNIEIKKENLLTGKP